MPRSVGVRVGSLAGAPLAAYIADGVGITDSATPVLAASATVTHGRQLTATNTGPEAAGYTLTDWTGSYLFNTANQIIVGKRFVNVGPQVTAANVIFRGCEFRQTDPNFFVMRLDGTDTLFEDCRWRPDTTSTAPVTLAQSYQQGIKMFTGLGLTVRRSEFWGFGNAIEFGGGNSSQTHPILVEECWMHDAADQSGDTYHHDGVLSSDGVSWVTVRRSRIVSGGNTNGIAFQTPAGGTRWSDITLQNNQFGGFGYTVNLGDDIPSNNVTFTGNEWDNVTIAPIFGPFKNNWTAFTGTRAWSGNTRKSDGSYWWPSDTSGHATDYTG